MTEIAFAPEVIIEMRDVYRWYNEQRPGFGEEFLRSMDAAFERLRRSPEAFAVVRKHYRRFIVRRFPYVIFYEIDDATLYILGVFHTATDPAAWPAKLRRRRRRKN